MSNFQNKSYKASYDEHPVQQSDPPTALNVYAPATTDNADAITQF